MSKGDFKKSSESIVPLRGVVRDGVLAAILDHNGNELGMPVTAQANVTGGIVNIVLSNTAAVDADGRPDGTIYVQTV